MHEGQASLQIGGQLGASQSTEVESREMQSRVE